MASFLRKDETDNWRTESTNWYFFVWSEGNKLKSDYVTGSKKNRNVLIEKIEKWEKSKTPYKIFGVWHGEWRTDVFELDPVKLVKRFKSSKIVEEE